MKNRKQFLRYKTNLTKWSKFGSYLQTECSNCGEKQKFYYDRFDAVCCIACDEWIDKACGDPNCPFCVERPATPSEALFYEEERNDLRKDWRRRNYQHKHDGEVRHAQKRELYADINDRKEK